MCKKIYKYLKEQHGKQCRLENKTFKANKYRTLIVQQ